MSKVRFRIITADLIPFFSIGLLLLFGSFWGDAEASLRRSPVVIAVEKVGPTVVNISTVVRGRVNPFFPFSGDDFFKDFFPDFFTREYTRTSLGSGVVIDGGKGYIVTNYHVVARAAEIKVITSDQSEYQARTLGSDPGSDLAILQIEVDRSLPEVSMGDSDELMIGETVIAIGNPFGLSHTVTTGVVSALDRTVRTEERVYRRFIQTDASINPGNSGGPLLNLDGELVGINTAIYQKAQGIGFAISINKAKRVVRELLRAGEVRIPWLGLEVQELTKELKTYFDFPLEKKGVMVSDLVPESPAARAGLKRGDILLSLGDIPIFTLSDYPEALTDFTPNDPIDLKIYRKDKEMRVLIQPSTFPLDLALALVDRRLGIRVAELDEATKGQYGLEGGVLIQNVRQDSGAGRIGLRSGDLILKVNDVQVTGLGVFKKAVSRYHHVPSLTLLIRRGPYGYSLTIPF
jgi:Do/DeqQ family serine protease